MIYLLQALTENAYVNTSPLHTLNVRGSVTPELLLQSEWMELTGSGATRPEVTGVMLGHPF